MRGSISSLIAGRALRSAPFFPRGKETGSFLPSVSRGNGGTFPQRRKRVRCFASTPKVRFADRTAIQGAKLGSQLRDCVRLVQTESLSLNCLTTVLLQVLQCLALPIYFTQSLSDFLCLVLDRLSLFAFYLSCSCCKLSAYRKVCHAPHLSKGLGLKREGEASFPFLCFWFLLSHHKRNILFSFPWKRNSLSFLLEEMQVLSCFP